MSGPKLCVIIPTYNKFAYARIAVRSLFKYTESSVHVLVLDDASPKFAQQNWKPEPGGWLEDLPRDKITIAHFDKNAGLTRSWNDGLRRAKAMGAEYTVCANSDIHFTPGWEHGLMYHLNHGYQLTGPVSNAPGHTNRGRQMVQNYYFGYKVTDDAQYLCQVAKALQETQPISKVIPVNINGFFMMAKTSVWWQGAFDRSNVFDPAKRMAGNEDELQRRWKKKGFKSGFVPSSFIFHYRSVTRGNRFKSHGWHRLQNIHKDV